MISKFIEYSPKTVYIPLTDNKAKLANIKVTVGDEVKVGTLLAEKYFGKIKSPVFSSVSGKVKAIEERLDCFGNLVDHVVIENNGKDEKDAKAALKEEESIKDRLIELGVEETSLDPVYTGVVYDNVEELFVVLAFPNEPLVRTDYGFLANNAKVVIEGAKYLAKAASLERVNILVSKRVPAEAVAALKEAAGDFKVRFIKVNTDDIGYAYKAVEKSTAFHVSPNKFSGAMVVSCSVAIAAYNAVVNGLPNANRTVVLSGDAINEQVTVLTKVGTPISELVENCAGGAKDVKASATLGKIYNGLPCVSLDVVVTENVNAIHFVEAKDELVSPCDKCGICNDACPVGILPEHFIQAYELKDDEKIRNLGVLNCVECGKCSFVCPNGVNVLEVIRRAKRRIQ